MTEPARQPIRRLLLFAVTMAVLALLVRPSLANEGDGTVPKADENRQKSLEERINSIEEALKKTPDDLLLRIDLAKSVHLLGVAGDEDATYRAKKLLSKLHADHPDNATVNVYLGSNALIRASLTWAVWKKGDLTKTGLALMDQAVSDAPDRVEVRLIRGVSTQHLPDWMERADEAKEDIAWSAEHATDGVEAGELEPFLAASAFLNHGRALKKAGDVSGAMGAWEKAVALAPESEAGKEAADLLEEQE